MSAAGSRGLSTRAHFQSRRHPLAPDTPPLPHADWTLYCLVRTDLPLAVQLVQSVHAAHEAGRDHGQPEHGTCRVVMGRARDVADLQAWQRRLDFEGIAYSAFYEPDENRGLTALCTRPVAPHERKTFKTLDLWR